MLRIQKEISPGISLEGMMLKLKLQYFGHLMRRIDSLVLKQSSLLSEFATPLHSQELVLHHSCLPVKTGRDQKSAPLRGKRSPGLGPRSAG